MNIMEVDEDLKKPHNRPYKEGSFPTRCTICDVVYTETEWKALRYLGVSPGEIDGKRFYDDLEFRDCKACTTTLCIALAPEK